MTESEKAELEAYRRQDLLRRMEKISEDQWAAGWTNGLEHDLYLMTFCGAPAEYGRGPIPREQIAELKRLAELTQVWWVPTNKPGVRDTISLAEADSRFSKLIAQDEGGGTVTMSIPEAKRLYESSAQADWEYAPIPALLRETLPWTEYKLRSQPLITLSLREGRTYWELRFADTIIDLVKPAWLPTTN